MFGYVTASWKELTAEEQKRYGAVYCGICREIRQRSTGIGRICLSYDMAFLALLLMSLYEPEEESGKKACRLHSVKPRPWVDNEYIRYAADMNVALGYYNCLDDWQDDGKRSAKFMADKLEPFLPELEARWPRQLGAIKNCISRLSQLEKENCPNPDEPASCFGELMAQLLVYREDMWAKDLGQMGFSLGRFIYLLDAAADYDKDKRKGKYNPYLAMGMEKHEIVVRYNVGDHVKIVDGPLASFTGVVEEIEPEKNRVSVMVSMFGRETPVELELDQVEVQD